MADKVDPLIQQADAAAEALARRDSPDFNREIDPARESALDNAFAEISKTAPPMPAEADFGKTNGGVRVPIEGEPSPEEVAAQKAKEDAAAAEAAQKAAEEKAAADAAAANAEPAKKGLLEDLVVDPAAKPAAPAAPEDPYGQVKLRSDASPKTRETFEQLKTVAKQREEAALAEAQTARKQAEELQAKVAELEKRTVPDEVKTELEELRQFRAQFDTERDPEFRQKFDSRLNANYDTIYAKLQAHGLQATEVEKLKAFSPADRDSAIEGFLEKLPSMERKFIEAKLLDNINVGDERARALQEARAKADEILAKKKSEPVAQAENRIKEVATLLQPEILKLPWLHAKPIPATAAPEEKKRIEAENAVALELQEQLKTAIVDDSPATRARAALAVPLARHYSKAYVAEKARADALQAQLDDIRKASATARTARSAASPNAPAKPAAPANEDAGDAVDRLFAETTGRR